MGIPCVDRVNRNEKKTSGKKCATNEYKNKSFRRADIYCNIARRTSQDGIG